MYKQYLALNNHQKLICFKTPHQLVFPSALDYSLFIVKNRSETWVLFSSIGIFPDKIEDL